jgi:hypothetical protein
MVRLGSEPPAILLTDHLEGDRPILVYGVDDLALTTATLTTRGWAAGRAIELPPGPAVSFTTPGGHRFALLQATRPGVVDSFAGRVDFEV